jgi:hypothetical protein
MYDHINRDLPLVNMHIAQYSDAAIVEILVPHSVFDGPGMGLIIHAIDAELKGEAWDIPPLNEVNPLEKRLEEVKEMEFSKEEKEKTSFLYVSSPSFSPLPTDESVSRTGWSGMWPISNLLRLVAGALYELIWHKAEEGCVFVGEELLESIISEAKEGVKMETDGKEFVSENDIIWNWVYQVRRVVPLPSCYPSTRVYVRLC